jgi:hypothetical protein
MSSKPEANFVRSVNKLLPVGIYHEGMSNPYRGGTPDRWYDGPKNDLWVEFKWFASLPPRIIPNLSPLQKAWLERAHRNGRNVAVILGSPDGCYIYTNMAWLQVIPRETYKALSITKRNVAEWITNQVL